MSDEYDTIPAEALKEVAYLSRSANRVEILQTLTGFDGVDRGLADDARPNRERTGRPWVGTAD